jgi:hypothetical protein
VTGPLELDELVEHFTLLPDDLALLRNKTGATRLGFAIMAKYLPWKGRFPRGRSDLPDKLVQFVAKQVKVSAAEIDLYDWGGRTIKGHRKELREALGWRPCSVPDAEKLAGLRWIDIDFDHATVSPTIPRVVVDHQVHDSAPKTKRARRRLALDPITLAALQAQRQLQAEDRQTVGRRYRDQVVLRPAEDEKEDRR